MCITWLHWPMALYTLMDSVNSETNKYFLGLYFQVETEAFHQHHRPTMLNDVYAHLQWMKGGAITNICCSKAYIVVESLHKWLLSRTLTMFCCVQIYFRFFFFVLVFVEKKKTVRWTEHSKCNLLYSMHELSSVELR